MAQRSLVLLPQNDERVAQSINDFQSEMAEITGAPYGFRVRAVLYILASMIITILVVSATVKLDTVVTASGRIVSRSPMIVVQPLETGVIRHIHVRPGQVVRKGDTIATMDATFTEADQAQLESSVAGLTAEVARLRAELDGAEYQPGPEATGPEVLQAAIWAHRKAELTSRLTSFDQKIQSGEEQRLSSLRDAEFYRSRLNVTTDIEKMRVDLANKEVGSRLNALLAKDVRLEIQRFLSTAEQLERAANNEIGTLKAEREAFLQEWRSKATQEFVTRQAALNQAQEELAKATRRQDLVDLRVQEDATVVKVADISNGSVIRSGEIIATLMPVNAPVEVEVEIAGADQGSVKIDDDVAIKLEAYSFIKYGTLLGKVTSVSENSFDRLDNGQPTTRLFFKGRIDIVDTNMTNVPDGFRLIPGMPVAADIVVGSRTILMYFAEPALRKTSEGFREPS